MKGGAKTGVRKSNGRSGSKSPRKASQAQLDWRQLIKDTAAQNEGMRVSEIAKLAKSIRDRGNMIKRGRSSGDNAIGREFIKGNVDHDVEGLKKMRFR